MRQLLRSENQALHPVLPDVHIGAQPRLLEARNVYIYESLLKMLLAAYLRKLTLEELALLGMVADVLTVSSGKCSSTA